MLRVTSAVAVLLLSATVGCNSTKTGIGGKTLPNVPETIDFDRRYLFYMHGMWLERHGLHRPHPRHGLYEYARIVHAFADRDFVVISEARLEEVSKKSYATKVARQARRLLERGVPPEHITVIGHSKGGLMALMVASELAEPKMNFVVMAGCGKRGSTFRGRYVKFLRKRAAEVQGHVLSLYDLTDHVAGTCQEVFDRASNATSEERVFQTGRGHGLFYAPEPIWIDEVVKWAGLRFSPRPSGEAVRSWHSFEPGGPRGALR
jgi:hypothetical protein